MRKIYLAFLGKGQKGGYEETVYELDGQSATPTRFVQAAEIELIGKDYFDKVIIVATEASRESSFEGLMAALKTIGANTADVIPVTITEDMSSRGQWEWFEEILGYIDQGDELTVDLTHGYRSIPIVLSTAIYFLQKAKKIIINAVYYGAYEKDRQKTPIIDMKEFYLINEWAEGVSRLVEDADARKIAELTEFSSSFQTGHLKDSTLVNALNDLTHSIRDVDIHHIAEKAGYVIRLIREKEKTSSKTEKVLFNLVIDKFIALTVRKPLAGYTRDYFDIQLEIISLLLDHRLFMQAFTVMRELIGSMGLIQEKKNITSSDGRKLRRKAELFIRMVSIEKCKWQFNDDDNTIKEKLIPLFSQLESTGVEPELRSFVKELTEYRNGFDHAWTSKNGSKQDIEDKGKMYFRKLESVINRLIELNMI